MEKLFLDANVLFSAAYQEENGLLKFWQLKGVILLTSHYAYEEALRNLDSSEKKRRLERLIKVVKIVEEVSVEKCIIPLSISLPKKDEPILGAALQAKADYLITGDVRHFGKYFSKRIAGMMVCPPAHFFKSRTP